MIRAIAQALRQYATFQGRTARREAWLFLGFFIVGNYLLVNATKLALVMENYAVAKPMSFLSWLFFWSLILPMSALTARRLQDTGRSGVLTVLPTAAVLLVSVNERRLITQGYEALVPIFIVTAPIFLWFFYWLSRPGEPGTNAYGPPPGA